MLLLYPTPSRCGSRRTRTLFLFLLTSPLSYLHMDFLCVRALSVVTPTLIFLVNSSVDLFLFDYVDAVANQRIFSCVVSPFLTDLCKTDRYMLQPPLSLSPTRLGRPITVSKSSAPASRPLSATTGNHRGGSNFTVDKKPLSASASASSTEAMLVANLKQQVQCLELEVKYLKSSSSPAHGGRQGIDIPSTTSAQARQAAAHNTTIGSIGRNGDDLLRRADELEAEVIDLRQKYAMREQEYQLELASLRQRIDREGRQAGAHQSWQDAIERRESQLKSDISSMKQLHAQEVVALQRTIERLQLEQQNSQSHIAHLFTERETCGKEITALRDAARSAMTAQESAQKQLQEAMVHLASEQSARRAAELKEAKWQEDIAAAQNQVVSLEKRLAESVDGRQKAMTELQNRGYEVDQLRLTVARQKDDLAKAAADVTEAKGKADSMTATFSELESKLAKAAQGLVDLQSEREFFRLQCDRLKVENSVLEVRAAQFEQALNAERASLLTLERQLCTALDQADSLRREARAKEDVYRGIDAHATDVRVQLRLVQDERDALVKRYEEASSELHKLQSRYEHVRHLEDQQKTEAQLHQALAQLAKSKHEMQTILSQQQRVTDEFAAVLIDLPEVAPHNRSHYVSHAGDISVVAPPVHQQQVEVASADAVQLTPPAMPTTVSDLQDATTAPAVMSAEELRKELTDMSNRIAEEEKRAASLLLKRDA